MTGSGQRHRFGNVPSMSALASKAAVTCALANGRDVPEAAIRQFALPPFTPLSLRKTGFDVAVNEMLPVGIVAERLRASPFVRREMRKLRKEFARFLAGLGHSPELSQGCGQGPPRDGCTCCLVA